MPVSYTHLDVYKRQPRTVVVPDLIVARSGDFTEKDLPRAPLLAVEILSPSTRRLELTLKRDLYAEAGTAAYWVLDPQVPSITSWTLRGLSLIHI